MAEAIRTYEHSDAYWVGWLSSAIVRYLRGTTGTRDLEASLKTFLRSPVATPDLLLELGVGRSRQVLKPD
jgi:hypothetical protein